MKKTIAEKAKLINLNRPLNGSLAEIGAGQEVARWFFKVGGAAGTIAKAMSAYDMTFSDDIYGREESGRYVVESRLRKMLTHEFDLLQDRLGDGNKYFFAFANTVAAKSYKYKGDCHGWMGVQFQRKPGEAPNKVIIHVRMLDKSNLQQQEALGILGVNLIYGAYYHYSDIATYLHSLADGELEDRVEVNVVRFEGPLFDDHEPIEASLNLLAAGLTQSVLFPSNQKTSHLQEELYNKQVIIHRGEFDPPLITDLDILLSARNHYCGDKTEGICDPYLISAVEFNKDSFKEIQGKIEKLHKCNQHVLVNTFEHAYELSEYIALFTKNHINFVVRAKKLIEILEEREFDTLGPLARVFNEKTRIYIYPTATEKVDKRFHKSPDKPLFELSDYQPSEKNAFLFQHLVKSEYLQAITCFNKDYACWDREIFEKTKKKEMLPPELR